MAFPPVDHTNENRGAACPNRRYDRPEAVGQPVGRSADRKIRLLAEYVATPCLGGIVGVLIAANPEHGPNLVLDVMCLAAGFC
jgi:hypothetical protein